MRVALLTDGIEAGSPGFRSYITALARGLEEMPDAAECTLVHRGRDPFYEGRAHRVVDLGRGPLVRQARLPRRLMRMGFDLVHDTYHFGPFLLPSTFTRVLTIGDLTPIVTGTHTAKQRWSHRLLLPVIAHRAHRIVTFSECSKRDIVRLLHVASGRVTVTHLAASAAFRPLPDGEVREARVRLGLPERYLLHVGTIEPRKNVARLVRAYASVRSEVDGAKLLLVGRYGWRMSHLPQLIRELGVEGDVIVRDDIVDGDLPAVYNAALALVYPSLYEGFGLPPLEAMQCGVPVLASNTSSLPEVVADAAISVDPLATAAIAAGMVRLATEPVLRAEMRDQGIRRAATFTARRLAERTLGAYALAAEGHRSRSRVLDTRAEA